MSTKFEQLLDLLVNEEMDKANELFHEIVVEQSRSIYENLIDEEEEEEMDEASEEDDESMDEAEEEDDESVEENMDLEDSYMMDGDEEKDTMGGDPADDLGSDVEWATWAMMKKVVKVTKIPQSWTSRTLSKNLKQHLLN